MPVHLVIGVRLDDLAVTDAGLPRQSIVGGASIYPFVQNLLLALRAPGARRRDDDAARARRGGRQARCSRSPRRSRSRRTSASATARTPGPRSSRAGRWRSSRSPTAGASRCRRASARARARLWLARGPGCAPGDRACADGDLAGAVRRRRTGRHDHRHEHGRLRTGDAARSHSGGRRGRNDRRAGGHDHADQRRTEDRQVADDRRRRTRSEHRQRRRQKPRVRDQRQRLDGAARGPRDP